ncbi:MAG: DNA methyltransferase, partial [Chloroflexota bacterium]|nr:DNA methyltransferase [Chloroflexota bacterium]
MPRPRRTRAATGKQVETLRHEGETRTNIPTAEYQSLVREEQEAPLRVAYERRNHDLDPQLVWRGKDQQDLADLVVNVPPLYIQEKVHPKALIADLLRQSRENREAEEHQIDMFADFNGLPEGADRTEFYQHDGYWQNRMILGDSLQVMASLSEREGLQGRVQCIYIDPPYGIRFNSNFQWSTTTNTVRDRVDHITREPEQVKAFRDTWRDGVHSYLTYLRDRLTVARDLLADSGSIFVQIGDENVHRVRALMDEVFGEENFISLIQFRTKIPLNPIHIGNVCDFILWFGKSKGSLKFRRLFQNRPVGSDTQFRSLKLESGLERAWTREELADDKRLPPGSVPFRLTDLIASGYTESCHFSFSFEGENCYPPGANSWKTTPSGIERLKKADRIRKPGRIPAYQFFFSDYPLMEFTNQWSDTQGATGKTYVVQTANRVVERCILMTTDPGDLVLDPTCGAGTSAYVAEQWGRRWITIDTSRVALALARARIMGARYPYYLLADSKDGQLKEAELSGQVPSEMPTYSNVRQGFVYDRAPHITIGAIAQNTEIDVIWETAQEELEPLREELNAALGKSWEAWEVPRDADESWPEEAATLHALWWERRIELQRQIDASIAARADFEYLFDRPYIDNSKVRVAGPFTVESISPHRVLGVDENGEVIDHIAEPSNGYNTGYDFGQVILDNLKRSGVQQAHREDRITFNSLTPWPGRLVCAEGKYVEGGSGDDDDEAPSGPEKRAGIFVGPEFGTVSRPDLVEAAREAAECGFDVLIACAFNYDAHTTEFESLGRIPVLKARMNADLHMAGELKNTGKG